MIYVTGDTHGSFTRIARFCDKVHTSKQDILIILGDAGINFGGGRRDSNKKEFLSTLPITLFCIHGNHEQRPSTIQSYHELSRFGGTVYMEDHYPNIIFAKDGEIYDLQGKRTLVIGGAYSIDWMYRIPGLSWWEDEQPSEAVKARVTRSLAEHDWKVDVVLSHTVPLKYEPTEAFLPNVDQRSIDKSTEAWLDQLENHLCYEIWYCGHYHINKKQDRIQILFDDIMMIEPI